MSDCGFALTAHGPATSRLRNACHLVVQVSQASRHCVRNAERFSPRHRVGFQVVAQGALEYLTQCCLICTLVLLIFLIETKKMFVNSCFGHLQCQLSVL